MKKDVGSKEMTEAEEKEVMISKALDAWIYYLKHRHEESFQKKLEEIKAKDETIRDLDNSMLDLEDDVSFMRKISISIDEAFRNMDMEDVQQAREEARLAKEELELVKQEHKKLMQEARQEKD